MKEYNSKNTIYFGTKIENLALILENGIFKPLLRDEEYISVSVSGYCAPVEINCHEEVKELAQVYLFKYKACDLNENNKLHWKCGYNNSLTNIDGFGPSKRNHFNVFGKEVLNTRMNENISLILNNRNVDELIFPEKSELMIDYTYFSLALHPFIRKIEKHMIDGIIVSKNNFEKAGKILNELHFFTDLIKIEEMEDV